MSTETTGGGLLLDTNGTGSDLLAPAETVESTIGGAVSGGTSRALRIQTAQIRDKVRLLAVDVDGMHHQAQRDDLRSRTHTKAQKDLGSLLEELAVDRGLSWSDIARLVGVSVGAIRKWRNDGAATGENRLALARLAAFLDLLSELPVEDPGGWMEIPLVEGNTITALDIYQENGGDVALLDYAANPTSVEKVLDQFYPGWRNLDRSFETFTAADGALALRSRQQTGSS